jgi:hypothetical protein
MGEGVTMGCTKVGISPGLVQLETIKTEMKQIRGAKALTVGRPESEPSLMTGISA